MNDQYTFFTAHTEKIALMGCTLGLLSWDQEVKMPPKGAALRAENISYLSGLLHELRTDEKYVSSVKRLLEDTSLNEEQQVNIKETWRTMERSLRFSKEFVEEMSKTASECFVAWHKAKTEKKFELFAPLLEKMIGLKKQEAELVGYSGHPYNAFLDEYEPGLTVPEVDRLFTDVREQLVGFVKKIAAQPRPDDSFFSGDFEETKQENFCRLLLEKMGYDFSAGRMDRSAHPFCIGLHPTDTRVTYRLKRDDISEIIWSLTHEGGHALYEQGLRPENWGLPMGSAVSLSIHESQSRLWENNVSRSLPYWEHFLPELKKQFPGKMDLVTPEAFFKACNIVEPSFIRTSADELTYHFHIMIRYEIEKAIFDGSLSVNDLPGYWNRKYKEYLGIDVPDDAQGVLQDVHWSHGGFGYFPTYSLGSFYAAQFFRAAVQQIPGLKEQIGRGELTSLREWLRDNIHQHGMRYKAQDLCKRVTGEPLRFDYFMQYANEKYASIYPGIR
jgi:carboxypeptidase Taq